MIAIREVDEGQLSAEIDDCIDLVEAGGEVVITRHGIPILRLVAPAASRPAS